MPPKNRVYPLSLPKMKAMEDYIEEALSAGHICPSTSPVAAAFFFMEKKDGGLRPCIDYCRLNTITVHYPYPLPLVPAALEQLQGANIFLKLDLVLCLPVLNNTTSLLNWRSLTPAEANYDVGNRTLLFIKEALEEWCHWLEGARHPFLVLTDHRNLVYLHGSKRLNPLQWALFFTRSTSSQGFTTVMVTINWFSKACKLIPLKGLPPALETATTLFHHVFKNYGLPEDIGLAIRDGAIPKPGSDAAAQDALNGLSVEHGQDGRQKKHCWAFLVMELVLSDQIFLSCVCVCVYCMFEERRFHRHANQSQRTHSPEF
ncbi:hypothetical protein QTP70_018740 [Hemibagrus guttatus]|uniref:Reverse transcriptase RNase H-like domain-containing protein n=1 Tax=Hemibagrus guttatus TaxID=175788 RepID=A0AAE0URW6_9TELE|nr:hypothetical protein QTP70_018740 [Hemibagrus guttatus]